MKTSFFLSFFLFLSITLGAVTTNDNWNAKLKANPKFQELTPAMSNINLNDFLELTPKKYKAMTGKRLGIKKSIQLKVAQKFIRNSYSSEDGSTTPDDISKGLYILLAIIGLGWLAIGLFDDWEGSDWIINLVLTLLCWLPGLIHALVKMKKYY